MLNIRQAFPSDVPLILTFIKRLADYEKLSHEVTATEAQLESTLFGERAHAEVIIAEYAGEPAGFALFFHNYSTFLAKPGLYIEDIYVEPMFRGKGIGESLFRRLGKIALERDCGRLEWWVLDWNEPALRFYEKLGAEAMDEWTVYRIHGHTLQDLARA